MIRCPCLSHSCHAGSFSYVNVMIPLFVNDQKEGESLFYRNIDILYDKALSTAEQRLLIMTRNRDQGLVHLFSRAEGAMCRG